MFPVCLLVYVEGVCVMCVSRCPEVVLACSVVMCASTCFVFVSAGSLLGPS